jgi:hypothetical protein
VNAAADTTNRLSVTSPAVLFNRESASIQVKLNKQTSGDNASLIYQTNFSGRAEIGLTGDDDFHFKVSADGSTFRESLVLSKSTGRVTVKDSFLSLGAAESRSIAAGVITAGKSYVSVDTEGGAATDDLETVNGGAEGDVLMLKAAHDARTVVCKHGTGNLKLSGADFSLDGVQDRLTLLHDGTNWVELARANNG